MPTSTEVRTFVEGRVRAFDPSIDLTPGSRAQTSIVEPVVSFLGTDPIETDVLSFITDRFSQEFPDVWSGDPGVVSDVFAKPLTLFLESFKRSLNVIRNNQSLRDPSLLSDEAANDLGANFFVDRPAGGKSRGTARIYFQSPTNVSIDTTVRLFTASGLSFFPSASVFVSSEEMLFNREGQLFYADVEVTAEAEGVEYDIGTGDLGLTGIDGVVQAVRVSNPAKFSGGSFRPDTPEYVSRISEALTERSLNTRRGATARILEAFGADVRAVAVIGAGDPEMRRDLVSATGPGHAWITGPVTVYGSLALVRGQVVDGEVSDAPVPGDQLFVYLREVDYPGIPQKSRYVRLAIEEVVFGPMTGPYPLQAAWVVRWSGSFPPGFVFGPITQFSDGGFLRKGSVVIDSMPGAVGPSSVPSGDVHVFGHTDVYVRPPATEEASATPGAVSDAEPLVERQALETFGSGAATVRNKVSDAGADFVLAGVLAGDVLTVESGGDDEGTYRIGEVLATELRLVSDLTASRTGLRYRVSRKVRIDPFDPARRKLPFGTVSATDLSTLVGSRLFQLATNDSIAFGAVVGDTVRVLTGSDAGDFVVSGFDPGLGGLGILVDRPATATGGNLSYEILTRGAGLSRPLVRVRSIGLLDSSGQSTGVVVPPADPVAVVPTCDFSSARVLGSSVRATGFVLPDLTGYVTGPSTAAPSGPFNDQRYSLGFDTANGVYHPVQFADLTYAEFDYRSDTAGKCSWFLATVENESGTESFPPVDPKPGECLRIKTGPNKGSYLIRQVVKFKAKDVSSNKLWSYFLQIHGTFPVDVFRGLIDFLDTLAISPVSELPISGTFQWPSGFQAIYDNFAPRLHTTFLGHGVSPPSVDEIARAVDASAAVEYEWGLPARGVLRSYFEEPVRFEFGTADADNVVEFEFRPPTGEPFRFRPDPALYKEQQIVPPPVDGPTPVAEWPRDLLASSPATTTAPRFTGFPGDPSVFQAGVVAGDVLRVHREHGLAGYSTLGNPQFSVLVVAGSNRLVLANPGLSFQPDWVGHVLFVVEGPDAGSYRITRYVSATEVEASFQSSESSPIAVETGSGALWGDAAPNPKLVRPSGSFPASYVGKWLTVFGIGGRYQGTFEITARTTTTNPDDTLELDVAGWPAYPASGTFRAADWVVTEAPSPVPVPSADGITELHAVTPIRIYDSVPDDSPVTGVTNDLTVSRVSVSVPVHDGRDQPYSLVRANLRVVTPSEMSATRDGPFPFFDTQVVSLSPLPSANIPEGSHLSVDQSSYKSAGWRHVPADDTRTYSTEEEGFLDLPPYVLPEGSEDSPGSLALVHGAPIGIDYDRAGIVADVQAFVTAPSEKVTGASFLVRHFLPAYVSYEAAYSGGDAPSVVAEDVRRAVDNIPPGDPLDVSVLQDVIADHGGNPVTPTRAMSVVHDWDRRKWLELGENEVGGLASDLPYDGSRRVTYFAPGPDASGADPLPDGERIVLTQV